MQDFMDRYDDARLMFPCSDNVPCYLAAHGPKLMDFAAQRLDGAFSYLQTSRFSVEAKKKLGSGRLNLMQPTVFLEDEKSARAAARKAISIYLPLENYHRAWRERGFVDSDFAGEGTDEFVDELVVWGDDRQIATKFKEQFSCGADHLIIIPVKLDLKNELGWQRLGNIVKGAGQINA
jgi:probable F420-dependent oxidoreductase